MLFNIDLAETFFKYMNIALEPLKKFIMEMNFHFILIIISLLVILFIGVITCLIFILKLNKKVIKEKIANKKIEFEIIKILLLSFYCTNINKNKKLSLIAFYKNYLINLKKEILDLNTKLPKKYKENFTFNIDELFKLIK